VLVPLPHYNNSRSLVSFKDQWLLYVPPGLTLSKTGNARTVDTEARSRNHCCHWKAISITYSQSESVASVIQHEKRMRDIILSSLACLPLPYFSTFSHKRQDVRKNRHWTQNMFRFSLQVLSETFLTLRGIQRDTIINVNGSSCKASFFLSDF
jgi:hypothetical protein